MLNKIICFFFGHCPSRKPTFGGPFCTRCKKKLELNSCESCARYYTCWLKNIFERDIITEDCLLNGFKHYIR
jgi:hypothetical protein